MTNFSRNVQVWIYYPFCSFYVWLDMMVSAGGWFACKGSVRSLYAWLRAITCGRNFWDNPWNQNSTHTNNRTDRKKIRFTFQFHTQNTTTHLNKANFIHFSVSSKLLKVPSREGKTYNHTGSRGTRGHLQIYLLIQTTFGPKLHFFSLLEQVNFLSLSIQTRPRRYPTSFRTSLSRQH